MKVSAPMVMSGAVSPRARDKPMMTPVKNARNGRREDVIASHLAFVAPMP